MKTIPCEVVQDLLPSYIDGLTSDVTNKTIIPPINWFSRLPAAKNAAAYWRQ